MDAVRQITVPSWMRAPQTKTVMGALNQGKDNALFVGGCIRNELMKKDVDDIDIATRLPPSEVIEILEQAGIRAIPTGMEHGTVTAVIEGKSFEITTLRRDVETHGRRATVAFTESWEEDAARRDFTINALFADSDGYIYDPTGQGLADLEAGCVRFVGDPATRIAEDYLRILRFFRFHTYYGSGAPDEAALKACRDAAGKIPLLSRERITQEFSKILMADKGAATLQLMFENGIMTELADSDYQPAILERLAALQEESAMPDLMARLVVLTDNIERLEQLLIFSNAQKSKFDALLEAKADITDLSNNNIKKLIYFYRAEIAGQALLLYAACNNTHADLSLVKNWQPPSFPVSGEDVMAVGIAPGPRVGQILQTLEHWWLDQDMPDRQACLQKLAGIIEG